MSSCLQRPRHSKQVAVARFFLPVLLLADSTECAAFAPDYVGLDRLFKLLAIVAAVALILVFTLIGGASAKDKGRGATSGALAAVLLIIFSAMGFRAHMSSREAEQQNVIDQRHADEVVLKGDFLGLCYSQAAESIPAVPVYARRVILIDVKDPAAKYFSEVFPTSPSAADVEMASNLDGIPQEKNVIVVKRTLKNVKSFGAARIDLMKIEVIDSMTGAHLAERLDFKLNGKACLFPWYWRDVYHDVMPLIVAHVPGQGQRRTDQWIKKVPRHYGPSQLVSKSSAAREDFKAAVLPTEASKEHRNLTFGGANLGIRISTGDTTMRLVGATLLPERILAFYNPGLGAPGLLVQTWSRETSRLLRENHIMLPREMNDSYLSTHTENNWRVVSESVQLLNGKLHLDLIQQEFDPTTSPDRFSRYSIAADWIGERSEAPSLPDHLDEDSYLAFALPENEVAQKVDEKDAVGEWISYPAGTTWSFGTDGTVTFDPWEKPGLWKSEGGRVEVESVGYHWRKFAIRSSIDKRHMEVTETTKQGTYRPFILVRNPAKP